MKRQHRGMAVVEPKLTQKEIARRMAKLAKAVPPLRSFQMQTKALLAVGSLFKSVTDLYMAGFTLGDVLKTVNDCIRAQLRTMGHTGKIEFPCDPKPLKHTAQAMADFGRWKMKQDIARAKTIKKYKAQVSKCVGKSRKVCPNPKCKRTTLKRWAGSFGKKYLLCSRCGWTNRRSAFNALEPVPDTLSEKVKEVLSRNFPGSSVFITPGYRDNIHVTVTTNQFAGTISKERTDMLWKAIDEGKELTSAEKSRISLLVPQTCFERKMREV